MFLFQPVGFTFFFIFLPIPSGEGAGIEQAAAWYLVDGWA